MIVSGTGMRVEVGMRVGASLGIGIGEVGRPRRAVTELMYDAPG